MSFPQQANEMEAHLRITEKLKKRFTFRKATVGEVSTMYQALAEQIQQQQQQQQQHKNTSFFNRYYASNNNVVTNNSINNSSSMLFAGEANSYSNYNFDTDSRRRNMMFPNQYAALAYMAAAKCEENVHDKMLQDQQQKQGAFTSAASSSSSSAQPQTPSSASTSSQQHIKQLSDKKIKEANLYLEAARVFAQSEMLEQVFDVSTGANILNDDVNPAHNGHHLHFRRQQLATTASPSAKRRSPSTMALLGGMNMEEHTAEAVECYLNAIKVYEESQNFSMSSMIYSELADNLRILNKFEESARFYAKSAEACERILQQYNANANATANVAVAADPAAASSVGNNNNNNVSFAHFQALSLKNSFDCYLYCYDFENCCEILKKLINVCEIEIEKTKQLFGVTRQPDAALDMTAMASSVSDAFVSLSMGESADSSAINNNNNDNNNNSTSSSKQPELPLAPESYYVPMSNFETLLLEARISLLFILLIQKLKKETMEVLTKSFTNYLVVHNEEEDEEVVAEDNNNGENVNNINNNRNNEWIQFTQDIEPLLGYLVEACQANDIDTIRYLVQNDLQHLCTTQQVHLLEILLYVYENPLFMD